VTPLHRTSALATALLGGVALSGCALDEKVPKPTISLPAAFEAPQASPSHDADPLDHWWRIFSDPQLASLVEKALQSSPDARTALYRLQEAGADRNKSITGILPTGDLNASASDQYSRQSYSNLSPAIPPQFASFFTAANGSTQQYGASLNVSWEIDFYGKDFTTVKTANATYAAARFDYEASRLSLAAQVATDLFQARGIAAQLEDAQENETLARNLADVAKRKAEAGLSTTADAARTQSDAESAAAQVAALDAELRSAVRSLLVLVGDGAGSSSSLRITAAIAPPPPVPGSTPGILLKRRPDVREAEANLIKAAGQLRLDKLALFPSLSLQPGLQYTQQVESIYTITTASALGGLGLAAPILSLPRLMAEVRAQGARGRQAVAAYEKAVQSAYGDAENALTLVDADARRVRLLDDAARRSRFAFDAASRGYALGLTDLTSVIQSEQTWRQTRSNYTAAQVSALVDTVAAFKALGGGWDAGPEAGKTP